MGTKVNRGFTIMELLVVLAIIGMLFSIILASYSVIKQRNRDARRSADINQISRALALYFNDTRRYPVSVASTTLNGNDVVSTALKNAGSIPQVPADPVPGTYNYTYKTDASGLTYWISFCMETNSIKGYTADCSNTVSP